MNGILIHQHGAPEELRYQTLTPPEPGPDEVVLQTLVTSVNFADIKMRRSLYRGRKPPFTPGFDGVGVVLSTGAQVTQLQPGQRVAAYATGGSYAEQYRAKEVVCYPLPDEVSNEDATGIGVMITAYNALHWAARWTPTETLLVHAGAGGVGSSAIQIARALGAKTIFATVGSDDKVSKCQLFGADHVFNYQAEEFAPAVMEATQGRGVDVILDTVEGFILKQGLQALATFGRLVTFGHSGGEPASISSQPLHRENRAVIGYSSGGYRKHRPHLLQETAKTVLSLMAEDKIHTQIGARFPLSQASEAHRWVESRQSVGKALLYPDALFPSS